MHSIPESKPEKQKRPEFLTRVGDQFKNEPQIDAEKVAQAVFRVMQQKVTEGEIQDVKSILPEELEDLWPQ